ncbi:MAG TPA: plastocyanin/azurin family copper-binding protein [Solirubrobacterales bacterium]|jgi:plastocyanin|nr:plastocyanin/azurin family copper-binding protein [Solirubrobacterales bacterium]
MKKALPVALALVIASLALAACGGSDDSSSSAETQSQSGETTEADGSASGGEAEGGSAGSASAVDINAVEGSDLAYEQKSVDATAGKVTVNFTNPQAIPHDVDIEDASGEDVGETELISEDSDSVEVDLKPGTYTFFCSVPGHREAGMEGTIEVK